MAVGGIGSFSALTSYSGVNSSKANSELEFDKIYQQKTDSVEINSTAGNNDIMTIYEMLCSEFPEANYILEDRSDEKNLFFNNVDTRIGKDFGNPSKKNVFIDVGVIKKIQEDPSYYLEAKLDLQQIIEHYDEARTHGGSDLPYTTGELDYENVVRKLWQKKLKSWRVLNYQMQSIMTILKIRWILCWTILWIK